MTDPYTSALVGYTPPTPGAIQDMHAPDAVSAMVKLAETRKYYEDRVYRRLCMLQTDYTPSDSSDVYNIYELQKVENAIAERYKRELDWFKADANKVLTMPPAEHKKCRAEVEDMCAFSRDHALYLGLQSAFDEVLSKWVSNIEARAEEVRVQEAQTTLLEAKVAECPVDVQW